MKKAFLFLTAIIMVFGMTVSVSAYSERGTISYVDVIPTQGRVVRDAPTSGPTEISYDDTTMTFTPVVGMRVSFDVVQVGPNNFEARNLQEITCVDPPAGMVGWWPLDETSGTVAADIIGGNDGAHVNGPVPAPGMVGGALSFDGVDDVVSTPLINDYTSGVTFNAWVKTTSNDRVDVIIQNGGGINSSESGMGISLSFGKARFNSNHGVPGETNFALLGSLINDGIFHHVAGSWTGDATVDGANLYIDGVLVGTTTAGHSVITSSPRRTDIGGYAPITGTVAGVNNYNLAGVIDEVQIFNRVLTPAEIQAIYNAGSAGKCKVPPNQPPVADAGAGQNIYLTETAYLDASLSSDPDGDPIAAYLWAIDSAPTGSTAGLSCTACFNPGITPDVIGEYIMSLVVNDGDLDSAADTVIVNVTENLPPIAMASGSPTTGFYPVAVSFDATASSDPEGGPLTFAWDFGDGGIGSGALASHTYVAVDNYTAVVTVTDDFGNTDQASVAVSVNAPNMPPTVGPTATPVSGVAPLEVQFTANAADPEGAPLTYSWDFGDGGTSTEANPLHTYANAGTYVATVTISDGEFPVSGSVTVAVNPALDIEVTEAKADFGEHGKVKGKITMKAEFTYSGLPAATDVIRVVFDSITLLEAPFGEFEADDGKYKYKQKKLHAKIDFTKGEIKVSRHKMLLDGIDNSNGIDVVISFGNAVGTDHFAMAEDEDDHDHKKEMHHKKHHD